MTASTALTRLVGATGTAADLAQDAPALELGVGPLTRATLRGVSSVDLTLLTYRRRRWPVPRPP